MNILPKKKWHVRTKENVARVRRDEAKAAEEERNKKERAALAEQEHRTKILRERAAARTDAVFGVRASTSAQGPDGISSSVIEQNDGVDSASAGAQVAVDQTGHVNFFAELEADERKNLGTTNKEYEQEKKQEKEAEEKKIGLLKYLGEGSAEYTKEVPWYQRLPEKPLASSSSSSIPDKKPSVVRKQLEGIVGLGAPSRPTTASDTVVTPSDLKRAKRKLKKEKKRLRKEKKKLKKEKRSSKKRRRRSSRSSSSSTSESDSDEELPGPPKTDIAQLRAERLRRETEERAKADAVLRKARGLPEPVQAPLTKPTYKQRYNSQFNPEMARQNRPE